jgi:hypothetical protein
MGLIHLGFADILVLDYCIHVFLVLVSELGPFSCLALRAVVFGAVPAKGENYTDTCL